MKLLTAASTGVLNVTVVEKPAVATMSGEMSCDAP